MNQSTYNPAIIEKKWQSFWKKNQTFKAIDNSNKPKYYVLDMFPYPSGAGLHVGHVEGYTATDIIARYKRHKGFNVLHPMGWDSFGLPAEQYAIRTGTHPEKTTKTNIKNFHKQLESLGFSYDWDREISTSDPNMYKWTQWIFSKLYERGLAYEKEMPVNYCPFLGTVLANEEIEDGKSKEDGHPVERRMLKQWVLKITAYADRLIQDLDLVDWPESLKRQQINWIGKSEGATVQFQEEVTKEKFCVFTTRPDTLFGATYMVLSPEHPIVKTITTPAQRSKVETYKTQATRKSELERTELSKEKTGVWTGAFAINPVNQEKIPIWIADYVLISYGTGAIMSVPAHDERDFEFAKKFDLPIRPILDPHVVQQEDFIHENSTPCETRKKVLAADLCWTGTGSYINSSNKDISLENLDLVEAKKTITAWLEKQDLGQRSVHYKLRDWLFSRQRYWGEPFPILHFEDGSKRCLDLDELPLYPPKVDNYKPSGTGESPLSKVKDWVYLQDPKTGKSARRETNTMPQWAGSCWYYLRFCDPNNSKEAWSEEKENYWLPVDMYIGGVEHAVLHLLYARFWHKVLYDLNLVSTPEPFKTLRNQGIITSNTFLDASGNYVATENTREKKGEFYHKDSKEKLRYQIEKMSKSKLNGVTPDHIIHELGADSLRLYEMFMGPLEKEKIWNSKAVNGCRRFLNRFYDMVTSDKIQDDPEDCNEAQSLGHCLVYHVGKDIEKLQFNTAIARMMEFINEFTKLPVYPKSVLEKATLCLSSFAPHIAEELWSHLGHTDTLAYEKFPTVDESYLEKDSVTYIIQVNGRLRARLDLPKDQEKESLLSRAKEEQSILKHLEGTEIKKVIYVPNKLLNIVAH